MKFVNINGHTLHYNFIPCASNASDTTFLFINSLGTDFRIWNEVSESLKRYGNILLFDNRGHGLSSIVESTATLDAFADDAEALLKHLSIKKCIIAVDDNLQIHPTLHPKESEQLYFFKLICK